MLTLIEGIDLSSLFNFSTGLSDLIGFITIGTESAEELVSNIPMLGATGRDNSDARLVFDINDGRLDLEEDYPIDQQVFNETLC